MNYCCMSCKHTALNYAAPKRQLLQTQRLIPKVWALRNNHTMNGLNYTPYFAWLCWFLTASEALSQSLNFKIFFVEHAPRPPTRLRYNIGICTQTTVCGTRRTNPHSIMSTPPCSISGSTSVCVL